MVEIKIVYEGELRCQATHVPSQANFATDAPKDNMGKGESFSPTDLVATALGSCMLTLMGIASKNMNIDLTGTKVTVNKEMVKEPVRRIGKLAVQIDVPMQVDDKHKKMLERAALTCPVYKSLHPDVLVPTEFNWAD